MVSRGSIWMEQLLWTLKGRGQEPSFTPAFLGRVSHIAPARLPISFGHTLAPPLHLILDRFI